jgi:hypothetical protein
MAMRMETMMMTKDQGFTRQLSMIGSFFQTIRFEHKEPTRGCS